MLKIGLTGGIGCGKTTVANLFEKLGAPVIDADRIAHELVAPGQPALTEIAAAFGAEVLNADGGLNRQRLRQRIFLSSTCKQTLEAILHPKIYAEMERRLEHLTAPYAILSIPLLIETGNQAMVDRILVVDCPLQLQYRRVQARDHQDKEEIARIISSQATREERLQFADEVIVNDSTLADLAEQVEKIHRAYILLSSSGFTI